MGCDAREGKLSSFLSNELRYRRRPRMIFSVSVGFDALLVDFFKKSYVECHMGTWG